MLRVSLSIKKLDIIYLKFPQYYRYIRLICQARENFEFKQLYVNTVIRMDEEAFLMRLEHRMVLLRHRDNILQHNYLNFSVKII